MRYEQIGRRREKWKYIEGFGGDYQVSNHGRVRSCKYGDWRYLKFYHAGKNYVMVDLCKNGKYYKNYVHRLVALNFKKNYNNLPEVNHINGNKDDNNSSNLNWVNGVGNMKHARDILGFNQNGENSVNSKLTESKVKSIIKKYKTGSYSQQKLATEYSVSRALIYYIISRKLWKHLKID